MRKAPISLLCLLALSLPGAALAQFDDFLANSATLDCACIPGGSGVELTVTHTVTEAYPAEWTGWYLERQTVGACVPRVEVGADQPLPDQTGQSVVVLTDFPDPGRNVVYRILARTADGGHVGIYTGARMAYFHTACPGGPAFRGTIELLGGDFPAFAACPEECWIEVSPLETAVPEELAALAGTGVAVDVFGTLASGMDGDRLDIESWQESAVGCLVVDIAPGTWGGVKELYR